MRCRMPFASLPPSSRYLGSLFGLVNYVDQSGGSEKRQSMGKADKAESSTMTATGRSTISLSLKM